MDRLNQLRGEAAGSGNSTLDSSATPSEAYMTANESSKYFSLNEDDSSFDITPIKDISLASTVDTEKNITENDELISNLSPIAKKKDLLGGYKIGKQIEAANILSGGVDIFDDNDNSYDGDELVIDDNVEIDDKSNPELKLIEDNNLPFQKTEEITESIDNDQAIERKDTEVVLQIDGKNVNAIDIGNGLYLYRKAGEEELAAVQIVADDGDQPTFKFLKVRENAEGNLEVYEEIEIEVPKEVPTKDEKTEKNTSHVPIKDINKIISEPACNIVTERKSPQPEIKSIASTSDNDELNKALASENKPEINLNGKMMKYNETRKSPVIHSTPNKEGIPLTKTMVDMQLHPSRPLDKVKTIEVHTDNIKQKILDGQFKNKDLIDDQKSDVITANNEAEKLEKQIKFVGESQDDNKVEDSEILIQKHKERDALEDVKIHHTKSFKDTQILHPVNAKEKLESTEKYEENVSTNIIKSENPKTDFKGDLDKHTIQKTEEQKDKIGVNTKDRTNITEETDKEVLTESAIPGSNTRIDKSLIDLKENNQETKSEQIEDEKLVLQIKPESGKEIKPNLKEKIQDIKLAALPPEASLEGIDLKTSPESNSQKAASNKNSVIDVKNDSNNSITTENTPKEEIKESNISVTSPKPTATAPSNKAIDSKILPKHQGNLVISTCANKCDLKTQNSDQNKICKTDEIGIIHSIVKDTKSSDLATTCINETSKAITKTLELEKPILSHIPKVTVENQTSLIINKAAGTLKEPVTVSQIILENTGQNKSKQQESIQSVFTMKTQNQTPTEFKKIPAVVPLNQKKAEISKIPTINNNAAVPFGQWTSANRQEFLNKIKEVKVPVNVSNTKSISKPNDLNRRDVLLKIDIQRQSSNAASKTHELTKPKLSIKNEIPTFTNKPLANPAKIVQESQAPLKVEVKTVKHTVLSKKHEKPVTGEISKKVQPSSTVTSTYPAKPEVPNRNEFNNQHLIDRTVEGIINRAVSAKHEDVTNKPKEPIKTQTAFGTAFKTRDSKPSILDAIEMKMNELHGIPFVERPPHELPKVYNRDIKTYGKADNVKLTTNKVSQVPNLLPVPKYQHKGVKDDVIELDSEDEVIEHEPITGDIDLNKKNITSKQSNTSAETNVAQIGSDSSKKESIITERDFDKFVRRNSITYENCLTVNIEKNKNRNVVQGLIQKEAADKTAKRVMSEFKISSLNQKPATSNLHTNKIQLTSKLVPVSEDVLNKNYHTKLQMAYQTALTTKRQMESPITIIEDKPVKVVFMESNTNFQASQCNLLGQELSPGKKQLVPKESDSITISTCDSIDSEVLDAVEEIKPQDEFKSNKTKHQRKQVLTPVETPELELIVPGDLGIEVSPKKKRRLDDVKTDKSPRNVVPKKSYLLGRNTHTENPTPQDLTTDVSSKLEEQKDMIISHNDTATAIDNLVKAAELIENQSSNFKPNTDTLAINATSPITPAKRGRGRPRKYPLPDGASDNAKAPSPQKKPRLIDIKANSKARQTTSDEDNSSDDGFVSENWTMGKINEKIVCPICNKLFRSENVVFKHVKHCTGPSPNRSDSDRRSPRRSRLSHDSKSIDSKVDDTDGEIDSVHSKISTAKKQKTKDLSLDDKEDIIVIEDTPIKSKAERSVEPKQHEPRKLTKTKAEYKASTLSCEYCGKTFRQLSYLVSHKLLHKKDNPKSEVQVQEKTVFSCEVCKKEFRKLHHLVQHRFAHNGNTVKPRKKSADQDVENKTSKDKEIKQAEDQTAAFRCEPCDKSFRKLHHLVEHRETHDGINRQKATTSQNPEKVIQNPPPPPQCDVCKKTFRKLHHLIEHKEQHVTSNSSEVSEDKSVKATLFAKDNIIHECPLCYMVFPNAHSLDKHTVFCQRKKKQPVQPAKPVDETVAENVEPPAEKESIPHEQIVSKPFEAVNSEASKNDANIIENTTKTTVDIPETTDNNSEKREESHLELPIVINTNEIIQKSDDSPVITVKDPPSEVPQELKIIKEKSEVGIKDTVDIPKKKTPSKGVTAAYSAKRRKSNLPLARIKESIALESSDDDDVRYMLNPNYKESPLKPDTVESLEGTLFMKVKAKKRNSLQFERPNSKDLIKKRTSLQSLARVPRTKTKITESKHSIAYPLPNTSNAAAKAESIDSDDSDVKYSFPDVVLKTMNSVKVQKIESEKTPKDNKRKSLEQKRRTLSGIARKKSLGKTKIDKQIEKPSPVKEVKRRRVEVEHRCDCGQLFSSAALLSRHTSLAHTPPRVRRRRTASPPPPAPPILPTRKSSNKSTDSRKSSVRSDTDNTSPPKKPGRPPGKTTARTPVRKSIKAEEPKSTSSSKLQSRKMAAHRGVPVPEKMRKVIEKL